MGCDIGFKGHDHYLFTKNAKVANLAITKEVQLGHTIGPFTVPPFANFICNALGARPKKTREHRIIMDLSQPINDSVNLNIEKELYSVNYMCIDDAVKILLMIGPGAFMAKLDMKNAFCLCPVRKYNWHLLGFLLGSITVITSYHSDCIRLLQVNAVE